MGTDWPMVGLCICIGGIAMGGMPMGGMPMGAMGMVGLCCICIGGIAMDGMDIIGIDDIGGAMGIGGGGRNMAMGTCRCCCGGDKNASCCTADNDGVGRGGGITKKR